MSRYTCGPYHVHERESSEIWAARGPIAKTVPRANDDGSEEDANARLLAASWNMLMTLKAVQAAHNVPRLIPIELVERTITEAEPALPNE